MGLGVALAILAAVAALAYRSIDAAADTVGWVEHTQRVLQQIEGVSGGYARAVSARRAYIIAGDASELAGTGGLDERLAGAIAELRGSIADEPAQLRRLDALRELLEKRVATLDASVEARRRGAAGLETADGLALAAGIRSLREDMEREENARLVDRNARTRRDVARSKTLQIVGTVVSFALLFAAFRRLWSEIALRRRTEQALRAGEGFLDSIVENLPDMIFVKDAAELRFVRINRAGEELLGIDRAALLHKSDADFFPGEQAEFFQARDRETLAGRVVVDIPEEPIQTKSGQRWLHTKKVPVLDEEGGAKFLLGISEDITARREAEAELVQAKEAADAANQELESFSYSVAHDLRAPLRAIDGFSQAIEEDCAKTLDPEGVAHLGRVRAAAQQMGHLIDGLLGLSRLTRGELVREQVDLTRMAREIGERLHGANPDRDVELVVEEGLSAEGDARLILAAFENLVGNAWKFTRKREKARVEVGKTMQGDVTVFFVRDNGAGFDQTYADKLFGAFQRLHAEGEFEGSGIGLATVARIVRRHGGKIWAEGQVGRGATFSFTL
jgi:PAS domain S-box-containing protein